MWDGSVCVCPVTRPNFHREFVRCVAACGPGSAWNERENRCACDATTPLFDESIGRCVARPSAPPPSTPSPPSAPIAAPRIGTVVDPFWSSGTTDRVGQVMTDRARRFASGFTAVTEMIRATMLADREGVTVPGTVGPAFCYRVIPAEDDGLRDVDLFLLDTAGRQIDADRSPERVPIVGLNRPLCVPPGAPAITAQIRIRAVGRGDVGLQIFAIPYNGQLIGAAR